MHRYHNVMVRGGDKVLIPILLPVEIPIRWTEVKTGMCVIPGTLHGLAPVYAALSPSPGPARIG